MNKQSDIDKFFEPVSLKRLKLEKAANGHDKSEIPCDHNTTESLYQSLVQQDDESLSPKSLKSKQILVDLKSQEKQVAESIK
jgi:hypothetical protein